MIESSNAKEVYQHHAHNWRQIQSYLERRENALERWPSLACNNNIDKKTKNRTLMWRAARWRRSTGRRSGRKPEGFTR
jgi:hypothetical protein